MEPYKTGLYVIYDVVAQESGTILELKNDQVAQRIVQNMLRENKLSARDFRLYLLGRYNNETMQLFINEKLEIAIPEVKDE